MNKQLLGIYVLIMLECRLSLEEASQIFKIPKEELEQAITNREDIGEIYLRAIKYLIYTESYSTPVLDNQKGIFKAKMLYNRLIKILKIENVLEKKEFLTNFIQELKGPDVIKIRDSSGKFYNNEERRLLLKFKLKYGLSNRLFTTLTGIEARKLSNWEEDLDDQYLKLRLQKLRDHGKDTTPFTLKLIRENKLKRYDN